MNGGDFIITGIDTAALPAAMLALTKQHLRVDFPDDDTVIQQYLANAIEIFEQVSGQRVATTTVDWMPTLNDADYAYQCPVQPVSSFTILSGGADVSAEYALAITSMITPPWLYHKDKTPFPADATIALIAGFADATMPPAWTGAILRITGTLYELRETVTTPLINVPMWLNDLIVGNWIPRA